jgi:hypothetical protein
MTLGGKGLKHNPFLKTETCENGKKIPERSRSVSGRFYCICIYLLFIVYLTTTTLVNPVKRTMVG